MEIVPYLNILPINPLDTDVILSIAKDPYPKYRK